MLKNSEKPRTNVEKSEDDGDAKQGVFFSLEFLACVFGQVTSNGVGG